MPTLLEAYLSEIAKYLCALPLKRREEELREIRQHLLNAVTVNQELGQSEEDAAANAMMQFGTAEDLGGNLVWAWRRERKLNKRSLWGAAACTFALLFLAAFSEAAFVRAYFNPIVTAHLLNAQYVLLAFELSGPCVAGTVTGNLFPKRIVAGSTIGVLAYTIFCTCTYACWLVQPIHLHQLGSVSPLEIALRFLVPLAVEGVVALGAAWISSRARQAWNERNRVARA